MEQPIKNCWLNPFQSIKYSIFFVSSSLGSGLLAPDLWQLILAIDVLVLVFFLVLCRIHWSRYYALTPDAVLIYRGGILEFRRDAVQVSQTNKTLTLQQRNDTFTIDLSRIRKTDRLKTMQYFQLTDAASR